MYLYIAYVMLFVINIIVLRKDNVVWGWGEKLSCFKSDFNVINTFFEFFYNLPSERLKQFTFYVKLIDDIRET